MEHCIAYEGKKVALGQLQEAYGVNFMQWANRRIGIEGTNMRAPYSMEMWREYTHNLDKSKGKDEAFAILRRTADTDGGWQYVGHTGLHRIQWPDGTAASGSLIGDADSRQKGCGTEAKLLLLYHAFMVLGLRKVNSMVKAWNGLSLGHLVKCGYQIIGRRRQEIFHEGRYVDAILLEVFRSDWEPIWQAYQSTGTLPSLSPEQKDSVRIETAQ